MPQAVEGASDAERQTSQWCSFGPAYPRNGRSQAREVSSTARASAAQQTATRGHRTQRPAAAPARLAASPPQEAAAHLRLAARAPGGTDGHPAQSQGGGHGGKRRGTAHVRGLGKSTLERSAFQVVGAPQLRRGDLDREETEAQPVKL
jgi:hypothetical protein